MEKLNGMINLSKIDKKFIKTNKNGEKVIYVDVVPNRNGADQYGNTHSVQIWDKDEKKTIYLGNLKNVVVGNGGSAPQGAAPTGDKDKDDLPF